MSIIGTRPPLISETNFYELHHRARLAIKPGITGMWQVSGRSDITDFEEVVRLDKEYITNWNIGLALIENRWKLSTKEIVIENEYFYIENEEKPCSHQCEKGTCCINSQVGIGKGKSSPTCAKQHKQLIF